MPATDPPILLAPEAAPPGTSLRPGPGALREGWTLAAILLLAAVLRFPALGQESLWYDEAMSAFEAGRPTLAATLNKAAEFDSSSPPLFPILLHGWLRLVPDTDGTVRIPSAVAGLLGVFFVWAAARRWAGPRAALVAAGLVAASPFVLRYAREARPYSIAFMLSALSGWLLAFVHERRGVRLGLLYAGALALLLHIHYTGYWVAAAWLGAGILLLEWRMVLYTLVGMAAALPVPLFYTNWEDSRWQTSWLLEKGGLGKTVRLVLCPNLPLAPPRAVAFAGAALLAGIAAALLFGLCWTLLLALDGRGREIRRGLARGLVLLLWCAGPFLFPAMAHWVLIHVSKGPERAMGGIDKYVMVAMPALFILIGWGLSAGPRFLGGAASLVLVLILGYGGVAMILAPERNDWRGVARALEARVPALEPLIVAPNHQKIPLRRVLGNRVGLLRPSVLQQGQEDAEIAWVGEARRFWIVVADEWVGTDPRWIPPYANLFNVERVADLPGAMVYRLDRRNP